MKKQSKYQELDYIMHKADGTEFTEVESDQFVDDLIALVESKGFRINGGMRPTDDEQDG